MLKNENEHAFIDGLLQPLHIPNEKWEKVFFWTSSLGCLRYKVNNAYMLFKY